MRDIHIEREEGNKTGCPRYQWLITSGAIAILLIFASFFLLYNPAKCDARCSPSECTAGEVWYGGQCQSYCIVYPCSCYPCLCDPCQCDPCQCTNFCPNGDVDKEQNGLGDGGLTKSCLGSSGKIGRASCRERVYVQV
jgi:hypothetical protein